MTPPVIIASSEVPAATAASPVVVATPPSVGVTAACRLVTKADVENVGASWGSPEGQIYRYIGIEGFKVENDRCTLGPNVQIEINTMENMTNASTFFESLVRSANEGVAPLAKPTELTALGDRARQLPGWVFVQKGSKVVTINITMLPPDGFAPPQNVLRLATVAITNIV